MDIGELALILTGISFVGYGILILFASERVAKLIGYSFKGPDSKIEFLSMYGGLEIGLGLFSFVGLFHDAYFRSALLATILTVGGLFLVRLGAFLVNKTEVTRYTYIALVFELILLVLTLWAFF